MDLKKSSERFLKNVWSTKFLFLTIALLAIFFLSISGISNAQYQYKTQQSSSKGGEALIKVTSPAENEVWEKGKRYTIKWQSKGILGNVKILLASESAKPIDISRSTVNSGSYNYVVPRTLGDGTYRVQVTKIDGSVKGESAAITIKGQTFGVAKSPQTGQPSTGVSQYGTQTGTGQTGGTAGTRSTQVAATPPAPTAPSSGAAPSTGTTPPAGTTASTGVTPSTAGAPSKAGTPSTGITGKTPTTAEKVVKLQFTAVKVSEAEVKNFKFQKSTVSAPDLKIGGHSTAGGKIEVFLPKDGDIWDADKEYQINWQSTGATGDVKIDLESTLIVGGKRYSLPITERAPNTGTYRFRVPQNWGQKDFSHVRVRVSTLDGSTSGVSPGTIRVFTRWIDLDCMIVDAKTMVQSTYYPFYRKTQKWIEFNVWMRNKGIRSPITINEVLVRIIKEPEGVVCNQETWGYGNIYYHEWYKLPEPRKFDVESWGHSFKDFNKNVDLEKGSYRIEVEVDPRNQLGESQEARDDNKAVVKYRIQ